MKPQFEGELERPRALLPPCILLLLAEAPGHGYELMDRLKPLGFDWDGPGPIYRELRALEAANLVTSAWSVPKAGPVPRVYELTSSGREALERSAAAMAELQALTGQYLARLGALRSPASSPASLPASSTPLATEAPPSRGAVHAAATAEAPPSRRRRPRRRDS